MNNIEKEHHHNNQRLIKQLQFDNELKTQWLSLIAHDFKGMFSNITRLLKAYEDKDISQEQFLAIIPEFKEEANKHSKTLQSTFEWISSQLRGSKLNCEEIVIYDLFLDLKEKFKVEIQRKQISVNFFGNQNTVVSSDRLLLNFVLKQILDNAIKYSYINGEIKMIAKSDSSGVHISIADNGIGMSKGVLDLLFTLEGSPYTGTMEEKGAGLSLVVVKDLVNKLNAKMTILSEIDKGTTVDLILI